MSQHDLLIGASSGIGLKLAEELLKEGSSVTAISRTQGDLPDEVAFVSCDVCQWSDPLPSLDTSFGGLVYLPGTINLKPFKQLTLDDFKRDIEVNYLSAVRVIQHYLPNLQEGASLVLMSSVAAYTGMSFHTSVSGAKAAIHGLMLSLASELAPKIRVNAVAPSLTQTPLAKELLKDTTRKESAAKRHPLQRVGDPSDSASAIKYLLSEEARWITGQVFHVDGGLSTLKLL